MRPPEIRLSLLRHVVTAGIIAIACTPVASVLAQPAVTFEERAVVVGGMKPASALLLFGISNEEERYPQRISHKTSMVQAGSDGTFRLTVPNRIPTGSIWVAADPKTGELTIAAPPGHKLKNVELPMSALKGRGNGSRARFESGANEQELLLIRPAAGVWRGSGGGSLELAGMTPIADSPAPPDDYAAGDVLVVIDPASLRVKTLRVR